MTGAMYAAVAGLKAHMSALNVIGNNVANVNTTAYKSARYIFAEELYTSIRSGSNGTSQVGGRNPAQIGYGCSIGQIDLDMSTKNYSPTGRILDCMIDGDGFLLVGDKNKSCMDQDDVQGFMLTRLCDLNFDESGYLVDGNGNCVYGFARIANYDEDGNLINTIITDEDGNELGDLSYSICPVLTEIRRPMCIKTTVERQNEETGVMEQYTSYEIRYPEYDESLERVVDWDGTIEQPDDGSTITKERVTIQSISLDEKTGRISGITSDEKSVVIGYLAIGQVDNPNGVTHVEGHYYQAMDGAGELHVTSMGGAVAYLRPQEADEDRPWETTLNVDVNSAGATSLVTGGLEASGTELATEISNMIMIQRGYQANTRIITVTDSMLEELVNMKRG